MMPQPIFSRAISIAILQHLKIGMLFPPPGNTEFENAEPDFLGILLRNHYIHGKLFREFVRTEVGAVQARHCYKVQLGGFPGFWPEFSFEFPGIVLSAMPIRLAGEKLVQPKHDDPRTIVFRFLIENEYLEEQAIMNAVSDSIIAFGLKEAAELRSAGKTVGNSPARNAIGYAMLNRVVPGQMELLGEQEISQKTPRALGLGLLEKVMAQLLS
ncbi:MAG: hypothetical protein HGA33_01390 [Candidatus Moranbacteria bacterium]|nr:hypothetical protein [Candidatus Moranbacteria bacterium]